VVFGALEAEGGVGDRFGRDGVGVQSGENVFVAEEGGDGGLAVLEIGLEAGKDFVERGGRWRLGAGRTDE
jgi:hypothetical protein